jgi:hypothetical protein
MSKGLGKLQIRILAMMQEADPVDERIQVNGRKILNGPSSKPKSGPSW